MSYKIRDNKTSKIMDNEDYLVCNNSVYGVKYFDGEFWLDLEIFEKMKNLKNQNFENSEKIKKFEISESRKNRKIQNLAKRLREKWKLLDDLVNMQKHLDPKAESQKNYISQIKILSAVVDKYKLEIEGFKKEINTIKRDKIAWVEKACVLKRENEDLKSKLECEKPVDEPKIRHFAKSVHYEYLQLINKIKEQNKKAQTPNQTDILDKELAEKINEGDSEILKAILKAILKKHHGC